MARVKYRQYLYIKIRDHLISESAAAVAMYGDPHTRFLKYVSEDSQMCSGLKY